LLRTNTLRKIALFVPLCLVACSEEDRDRGTDRDGAATSAGRSTDGGSAGGDDASAKLPLFSFFVTSLNALQELSGSQAGFGGDLRFGETGPGAGLRGADKICATIAERSMPGAGAKGWRAFLSATADDKGQQVDAIDRVGDGPWYDRLGRLVAPTKMDLVGFRPANGDPAIVNDLPNEDGVPNHQPDPTSPAVDNHDTLTGSNAEGRLYSSTATCLDWTTADGSLGGRPRVGHSWPRSASPGNGGFPFPGGEGGLPIRRTRRDGGSSPFPPNGGPPFPFPGGDGGLPFPFPGGEGGFPFPFPGGEGGLAGLVGGNFDYGHWISTLDEAGCGAGVAIVEMGGPNPANPTVGSGGGYGGFYCFALTP
jgi:hypothetical protein